MFKVVYIIVAAVLVLILIYLGFSLYVANKLVTPGIRHVDISPTLISENYDDVTFKAPDGLTLKGWLFKGSSNKLVIMVSGTNNTRVNTDYMTTLIAKELLELDYNVLLYDTRGNGESEGDKVTWGLAESNDILGAAKFAEEKGFEPENTGLIGDSLGAISILMVVDQLKDIKAIILDTPAASMREVISHVLETERGVPTFTHPTIFFFTKNVFGLDVDKIKTIEKIKLAPERKFLFIHVENDMVIPLENSKQLHSATNKRGKLVVFPKGNHVETYKMNPELYRKEVFGFLEKELATQK